jgi:hypothetical protein
MPCQKQKNSGREWQERLTRVPNPMRERGTHRLVAMACGPSLTRRVMKNQCLTQKRNFKTHASGWDQCAVPRSRVLKLRFFVEWPTAFFNIASGQRPWARRTRPHFGQRPNSIPNVWADVGRWPTHSPLFSIPGAMPQATIMKAFGQQNRMQKRNFKTHASGWD